MRRIERDDGFVGRSATDADLPGMLAVLQGSFEAWPPVVTDRSALEFLDWKMHPPGVGSEVHGLVEFEGEVVACKLRWFARAVLCGTEQVTDVGADQAVLPGFQGRGLARLLNDLEEIERPHGTVSFERRPRQAAVRHMEVEHSSHALRAWSRPLRAGAHVRTHLRHGGAVALGRATASAVARLVTRWDERPHETVEVQEFDERADELWEAVRGTFDLARIRDAAYLNWRYGDRRGGRRVIVAAFADGRAASGALLAYGVFRESGRAIHVLDLLVHPHHPNAGVAVLGRAVALGRVRGSEEVVAWVTPGHLDEPVYTAAGFVAVDAFPVDYKVPRGVVAPDVGEQLDRVDLRRHVTMGDFDFA